MPRVINVDKNPTYPAAVRELKREGILKRRVRLRRCKYLNNIIEQDHRAVKKRTWLAKGYGSFLSASRTLEGIEVMHMIRKGRVRWLPRTTYEQKYNLSQSCSASPPRKRLPQGQDLL